MHNGILDDYILPEGAREDLMKAGFKMTQLEEGVSVMSGHDKGMAFRFFRHTEPNKEKTRLAKSTVLLHDSEDCIEWLKSKRTKTVERIRFLPEGLLKVHRDEKGEIEAITGIYAEAYERYLKKQASPGLSLDKWGYLDDASVANLVNAGIFTVEQFSASPRSKIDKFPQDIRDALDVAIAYVNGQAGRFEAEEQGKRILALQAEVSKRDDALAALQEQVRELMSFQKQVKKRTKPKKEEVESEQD